jgi:hypothetical protein
MAKDIGFLNWIKIGVRYHRPLFKFKQIVIKSIKSLATNKNAQGCLVIDMT